MVSVGYVSNFNGKRAYRVTMFGKPVDRFSSYFEAIEFAAELCDGYGWPGMYRGVKCTVRS